MSMRNLAIIAHVDHGKTTLIDGLFKQAGLFQAHQQVDERIMDSGDIEKERGITITAKNASFDWKEAHVNIVDTPGHVDFGGEVERALFMVDGALLLVDAAEGPLPQTRFVLRKALERGTKIIVVINKVDRPDARIDEVEEKLLELFYDLAVSDDQVNYPIFYASAKEGWASKSKTEKTEDFTPLLDAIVEYLPAPDVKAEDPFQLIVTNLTYSSFLGQVAIGRIEAGAVKEGERVVLINEDHESIPFTVTALEAFSGLSTERVKKLEAGNIALLAGAQAPKIGDTITTQEHNIPLPRIHVDPPSVAVRISVNTSPFAGQEGEYATSRKLEELLQKACLNNVALSYEQTESPEVFLLKGRGELQIVILLEELRREGYEMMVGRPEIILVEQDGQMMEPEEHMVIDIPDDRVGIVTEMLSQRGGRMEMMENMEGSQRVRLTFAIPARGLIGIRSRMLTETRGEAIYSSSFEKYIPYQGKRFSRMNGAMVSDRTGVTAQYGLFNLQPRGKLFVREGMRVYEGMIVGEFNKQNDLNVNAAKEKKLTNVRASGSDDSTKLTPIKEMELEFALEWIDEDEWMEVTPENIRMRKDELRTNMRKVVRK